MTLDLRYLHSKLKAKGFKIERSGDYYCRFYINGEVKTKVRSKAGGYSKKTYKVLSNNIVSKIYKTLHFDNKNQFKDFLECTFELEDYQRMLLDKGIIEFQVES